jgi:acyl-coenzyme A thioesterase PaaI-like protein
VTDEPILSVTQLRSLLVEFLPDRPGLDVVAVSPGGVQFTTSAAELSVRPGGPAIFAFADLSAYLTVSAYLGRTPMAMLTSSSISFLEAVEPNNLQAIVQAQRIGLRTGVFSAQVLDVQARVVAIATLHFSYPGHRSRSPEVVRSAVTGSNGAGVPRGNRAR